MAEVTHTEAEVRVITPERFDLSLNRDEAAAVLALVGSLSSGVFVLDDLYRKLDKLIPYVELPRVVGIDGRPVGALQFSGSEEE